MKTNRRKQVCVMAFITLLSTSLLTAQNDATYVLPIASDSVLGGIKVGDGLRIDSVTGVLFAEKSEITFPIEQRNTAIVSTGLNAGKNMSTAGVIAFGVEAGNSSSAMYSNMIGYKAGNATNSIDGCSNYIGYQAGYGAQGGYHNHIGYQAGYGASGDNTGTIFIGRYAGKNTTSSDGVVFMGGSTGENAQNITHSCFLAPRAGYQATNVSKGIYIGYEAGAYSNASYCILIGENAGRSLSSSNKIGNNNIILGNGTTLPGGTSNAFNIGNVLYGTGIQTTTGGYPTSTPRSAGKVGIGVINPQRTLHVNGTMLVTGNVEFGPAGNAWLKMTTDRNMRVNGTITANEINIKANVWADHVFGEDYRLAPLDEVSSFIQSNGHLPEIPSEREVKENGVDVMEMQAKLLQKIEELTLYIIDQQKQIDELKKNLK